MCKQCAPTWIPTPEATYPPLDEAPPLTRNVPHFSGEGAIYTPELLARREGNSKGIDPQFWRDLPAN